jgi:hypothetical protein
MATRSTIALEFADGTIGQIYCHWDGYLDHNGRILKDFYSNPFILRDLIDLGDLSILDTRIGVKRPFDNPYSFGTPEYDKFRSIYNGQCVAYGRDRGETNTKARYFNDWIDYNLESQVEEYNYILRRNGKWYVMREGEGTFMELDQAFWTEVTV